MLKDTPLISQVPVPPGSLAAASFSQIGYEDAYACVFYYPRPLAIEEVVKAFFSASPAWVGKLFLLRNRVVRLFGLKAPEAGNREEQLARFRVEPGETLGLFKVLKKTEKEVLIGEDDTHLDFRISFYMTPEKAANTYRLVLSTTVQFHNWFGRLYFLPVRPVHKRIVPAMMKGIVGELQKNAPQFDTAWIS